VQARSNTKDSVLEQGLYSPSSKILVVGDGNLSFSLSLARALFADKSSTGHLVATTYLSLRELKESYGYKEIEATISEIDSHQNCSVFHDIDATDLEDAEFWETTKDFDVVIFNFPCIPADDTAKDGQLEEIEDNRKLVSGFFESIKTVLATTSGARIDEV